MGGSGSQRIGHRWRDYRTRAGNRPVRDFISALSDEDAAEILAAMAEVKEEGLRAARHLRGEIFEVRADGANVSYRVLFSAEGKKGQVLLALEAFSKKTQRTPEKAIRLAEDRPGGLAQQGTLKGLSLLTISPM
jgi:phage-related protein